MVSLRCAADAPVAERHTRAIAKTHRSDTKKFTTLIVATASTFAATGRRPSRPMKAAISMTLPAIDVMPVATLNRAKRLNPRYGDRAR